MPEIAPLSLGPLVLAGDRLLVGITLIAFLVVAEALARRRGVETGWAWWTVLIGLVAARIGWGVAHPAAYLSRPHELLFFWQGGFLSWVGFAAGGAWVTMRVVREEVRAGDAGAAALAATVAALAGLALLPSAAERPALTELQVEVLLLEGDVEQVSSWVGKPTVVNLWATWCGPCRRELPLLLEVAGGREDVRLALVSQGEADATVSGYLEREGLPSGDVRLDPSRALGRAVDLAGYPTTLFVSREGEVLELAIGELSRARLLRGMAAIGVPAREVETADATGRSGVR